MQNQIDRIKAAENALNRAEKAVEELGRAWSAYTDAREDIALPERYLVSDDRRIDLEADEAGQLPASLSRGVLSEDAIWNLPETHDVLIDEIRRALGSVKN